MVLAGAALCDVCETQPIKHDITYRTDTAQSVRWLGYGLDGTVRGSILGTVKAISSPKTTTLSLRGQEFSRDKADGKWPSTHFHLVLKLRKSGTIPLLPLDALMASRDNFTFILLAFWTNWAGFSALRVTSQSLQVFASRWGSKSCSMWTFHQRTITFIHSHRHWHAASCYPFAHLKSNSYSIW
jgi:hypothetical protein